MATIRRKMGHFGVTVVFHVEFEKIAYRQTGRWPKTELFGHSNEWVKSPLKSMAAVPLLHRVFGQCHKWPIFRRIVAIYLSLVFPNRGLREPDRPSRLAGWRRWFKVD
jgi:hypothetical protein